jgi:hypothetical protein
MKKSNAERPQKVNRDQTVEHLAHNDMTLSIETIGQQMWAKCSTVVGGMPSHPQRRRG